MPSVPNVERLKCIRPMPTLAQVDAIIDATAYAYEAGDYPDGMDEFTAAYVVGDGGLLNALGHLRRTLVILDAVLVR